MILLIFLVPIIGAAALVTPEEVVKGAFYKTSTIDEFEAYMHDRLHTFTLKPIGMEGGQKCDMWARYRDKVINHAITVYEISHLPRNEAENIILSRSVSVKYLDKVCGQHHQMMTDETRRKKKIAIGKPGVRVRSKKRSRVARMRANKGRRPSLVPYDPVRL